MVKTILMEYQINKYAKPQKNITKKINELWYEMSIYTKLIRYIIMNTERQHSYFVAEQCRIFEKCFG